MRSPWNYLKYTPILFILIAASAWKIWLVGRDAFPFNADEAVVALMGKHILAGERPVFFYGQAYMGSLDAFLVAVGFKLLGPHVWVIRLIQGLLYLGVLVTTWLVGRNGFSSERIGWVAAGLMAIPTVNMTLYTTVSLGGYGEALLLGNLIFLCALRIDYHGKIRPGSVAWGWWGIFGVLSGVGLWAFGLTLIYTIAAGIFLIVRRAPFPKQSWKDFSAGVGVASLGFAVGSAPWWLFAYQNGIGALILELTGSAVAVEGGDFLGRLGQHLINYLLLGVPAWWGLRPPWEVRWLGLALLPFVILIWSAVLVIAWRGLRQKPEHRPGLLLMWIFLGVHALAFLFTSFGVDPSGRYFIPLTIPLVLFASSALERLPDRLVRLGWLVLGVLIVYQAIGTWQSAMRMPPGITTQFGPETIVDHRSMPGLIDFLKEQGETRGYTNYWVAYPLAFLSNEELIFVPRLPYHLDFRYTARDDRYPVYTSMVHSSDQVAYITTRHPALEERLRSGFTQAGIQWMEAEIGDYHVFYRLSRPVSPEQLELISIQPP